MTIESVTWVNDLDPTYPAEGETGTLHEGNNHIRNIKAGLKNSFPNIGSAMSASAGVLNKLVGLTASAGDLNILVGAAAAGVSATSIVGLAGLSATAGELNLLAGATSLGGVTAMTAQATTSGSGKTFSGIPAGTKKITVTLAQVSNDSAGNNYIQLGDAGGLESGSYISGRAVVVSNESCDVIVETSYALVAAVTADTEYVSGVVEFFNVNGNTWAWSGVLYINGGATDRINMVSGMKTLSDTLTQLYVGAAGSFDSGIVNVLYE